MAVLLKIKKIFRTEISANHFHTTQFVNEILH